MMQPLYMGGLTPARAALPTCMRGLARVYMRTGLGSQMHRSLLNIMNTRCNETRNYIFIEESMLTQKLHDSVMDTVDN